MLGLSHLQPPSSGVTLPMDNSTISIASRAEFGISGKWGTLLGKKYGHTSPALSLLTSTLHWKLPPGTPLYLGLSIGTSQPSGHGEVLPPCGRFPELQALEPRIPTLQSHKACGAVKATSQRVISLCRSTTKNSKEGRWRDNRFPEVNINLTHTVLFFPSVRFLKKPMFYIYSIILI